MKSNPDKFVFRSQKKRYPWWVKSVDQITTEVDETIMEKPKKFVVHHLPRMDLEGMMNNVIKGRESYTKRIQNEEPGTRIQDAALSQGAGSFWWAGFKMNNEEPAGNPMDLINQAREKMVVNPQDFGIEGWKGNPQEASRLIEAAGIFLGAAQVGFTRVNEKWLPPWVVFDPEADKVTVEEDRTQRYPERYKYVITGVCQAPVAAGIRSPSAIGAAADRLGFEHAWLAVTRMIVFIQSLGYGAEYIPSMNPVPWAVASGLGEIGRMNRMISPLFGGSLRLYSIITDLPVALDKPIDFGLQEFCRHCKKCAEACPSGAVSMDKDPTWEWEGDQPWHYKGKKVWWEDSSKCLTYQTHERCINCVMSCPWTKDNKTVLHELAHIAAAKLPRLGGVFKKMDELFGYGLVKKTDGNMNDWWNYHDATNGFDSTRSRRG
jgi:epoxyqueuosine reductase